MRTNLPPDRRGLQVTEINSLWYLSADYPKRVQDAARAEIGRQW